MTYTCKIAPISNQDDCADPPLLTSVQDLNADFISARGRNLNFLDLEGLASTPANSSLADNGLTDCAHDDDCLSEKGGLRIVAPFSLDAAGRRGPKK